MAPRGAHAFSRMNSADTCSTESSVLDDDDLEQAEAAPSVCAGKSSERLLQEGRRRRGLVALALVVGAMVALCCWSAAKGPQLHAAAEGRQTSELSEKKGNESDDAGSHVVDVEESAVVSLAESIPKARLPVREEAAAARSIESSKAKALRNVRSAAAEAAAAPVSEQDEGRKEQSLEHSDMPGAASMEETKAASLERSDFPGAGDQKEQSLEQSNMPGIRGAAAAAARVRPAPKEPIAVLRPPSKGATSKPKKEAEDAKGPELSWSALGDLETEKVFM